MKLIIFQKIKLIGIIYANNFKDKKVCTVFREEEYQKQDGTVGVSIKPYTFRTMVDFKAGKIQEPKRKEIQKNSTFDDIEPINSDTMPF